MKIVIGIVASLALLGGLFAMAGPALAYQHMGAASDMAMGNSSDTMTSGLMGDMPMTWHNDSGKMFGMLSSIQNGEDGQPAWIVTGHWMMSNETGANGTGSNITDFYAGFQMIMLDGSAGHTHEIYNFTQTESTTDGNSTTVTGTSTVTLRDGPADDVETEITISQGKVVELSLDPAAVGNHFGETSIYGIVITPELMQHIMNNTMTSSRGGMMGHDWRGNETGAAMEEWK